MNPPRLLRLGLLAFAAVGFVGCSHLSSSRGRTVESRHQHPVTFALSVTVKGGLQPTPQQWAAIQARISGELLAVGHVLVTDLSLADRIIRIDFRPNPSDPTNSGNAVIVSVRDNPLRQLAVVSPPAVSPIRRTPYPTAFGFGQSSFVDSYHSLANPFHGFGHPYYGFGHSYYDGYTYSSPTLSPTTPVNPAPVQPPPTPVTPVAPPRHGPGRPYPGHPPGERPVCPPLLAVSTPVAPTAARVAYPSDRPTRAFVSAARSSVSDGRSNASGDRTDRTYVRADTTSSSRSWFGASSSSDASDRSDRYDRYTSHGSVDNSAASARRTESRSTSDRSYARDSSSTRDDSYRSKSDYSSSSYSGSSSYSSSSNSSYSSASSFSSSSDSSYSAPASSSPASSSGGSSGTHDSSSNAQQH